MLSNATATVSHTHPARMDSSSQRCKITVGGGDGIGRRIEAIYSCLAIAAAFDLEYVHQPLVRLQPPGTNVSRVNGWFGLNDLFGTEKGARLANSLPHKGRAPVLTSHKTDCRAETDSTKPGIRAMLSNATRAAVLGTVDAYGQPTWYQRLADGTHGCRSDYLYTGEDCFDGVRCRMERSNRKRGTSREE